MASHGHDRAAGRGDRRRRDRLAVLASGRLTKALDKIDRNQFPPDIIVALITGIAVGVAIYHLQLGRERKVMLGEWDRARQRMVEFINAHNFVPHMKVFGKFGSISSCVNSAQKYPLARWEQERGSGMLECWNASVRRCRRSGRYDRLGSIVMPVRNVTRWSSASTSSGVK